MADDDWQDCNKLLPYRDYTGRMVWLPHFTQRRQVRIDGRLVWQYRERARTEQDWSDNQW